MYATSSFRRRTGRQAAHASLAAIALASLMPAAAAAQTADPATDEQTAAAQEAQTPGAETAQAADEDAGARQVDGDIIVTGTRIVRSGFESPTPLNVLTREEIQNTSPTNNIADFVNQIPALAGSTRPSNSRLALSSGAAGINALDLRNLGEVRTLVLLDGRRSVGSTVTGLVDINTFPQALVRSVEIVTGGASATYGSDAVAGVVNFILDKRYEGLRVQADSGITTYGDGFNYSASVAGGTSFAGGRGHVLLNAELAEREGIFTVDREFNQLGFRTISNPAFTNLNGLPQNLVRFMTGTSNALPGGIINASTGGVPNRLRGLYFGLGGSVNQFNYGTINTPTLTTGGDWQLSDLSRRIGLDAAEERRGVFGRVSFELAQWLELFGEASYNWQETLFNAGPQFSTLVRLQADNAFLINTLGAARLQGITSVTVGTTAADLPVRQSNNQRDVQRYVLGAGGEFQLFGNSANWSAYGQYGQTNTREQLRNIMINARVNAATDAVFARAGNPGGFAPGTIVCRINVDANPNNNDPNCVPLNRLGIGVASQAAIDYVLGDPFRDQKLEQTVAALNLSFTPFATWAGDVSIAVGGEYRKEEVSGFVPPEFQTGFSVGNYLPTFGSFDVKEAYLETLVPLGFGLEFNGAVRATDYSTSGYVTTWKAGATWEPIEDIRFRATRSRDIRAPNLNELFQAGTSRTDTVDNPFTPVLGDRLTFRETTTGNLNLRPEKADSINAGVVLQPRFLPGFSASADYFEIKLKDAIGQLFAQAIVNRCFEGRQEFCAAFGPDPTGERDIFVRASPFNFSRLTVRGVDFEASYRLPIARVFSGVDGAFSLRGLATRYIDNIVNTGFSIPVNSVGENGGSGPPKWIYRVTASVDTPSFTITGTARGISSGNFGNNFIECQTDCPTGRPAEIVSQFPTIDDNSLPGLFYVDANVTTKFDVLGRGDGQFFINVTNLFNRDPLLLPEGGLSANTTYSDLLGRAFRVGVRIQTR
ncbi:MAG: TonB-dependent receptor [Pseudomonadota bacterium]|nr:TonB-dependent receptor [Pseudomonadota bacterium]